MDELVVENDVVADDVAVEPVEDAVEEAWHVVDFENTST